MTETGDGNTFNKPMPRMEDLVIGVKSKPASLSITEEDLCNPNLTYNRIVAPHNRTRPRGICLLINQENFNPHTTGQAKRSGTNIDADSIERTFIELGYFVNRASDLTLKKMLLFMTDISSQDHSQFDSFVCVILSHGSEGEIFATDAPIQTKDIFALFRGDRCPSLIGKPKMFFIQACRGMKFDKGVGQTTDAAGDCITYKLPVEADFFIANSTAEGFYAWRNEHTGSWFIQELCKVLKEAQQKALATGQEYDVASLMTVVARKVAILYESNTNDPGSSQMKQMVSFVSNLTRLAYLTKCPVSPT